MTRRSRLWFRATFSTISAVLIAACTFIGSRDVVQCRQNADCVVSTLPRPVCSQGLCVSGASVTDANPVDTDSGSDAGTDAKVIECVTTLDCPAEVGRPNLCADNRCVRITDPNPELHGCDTLYPSTEDYKNPNAIIFGVYTTIGSGITDQGGPGAVVHAIGQMGKSPPIIALLCRKERGKPNLVVEHMAALRIPLLIGQFETADIANITLLAKEKGVVVGSTLGTVASPNESVFLFQDRLASTAGGFQAAFNLMEERVNPIIGDAGRPTTKVALLRSSLEDTSQLLGALQNPDGGLIINGQPLPTVENANFKILDPATNGVIDVTSLHNGVFTPHVVIGLGGDNVATAVATIEQKFGAGTRPHYVLSARSRFNFVTQSFMQGSNGAAERARVIGVDFPGDVTKHRAEYVPTSPQDPSAAFDLLYDAMWVGALSFFVPVEGASKPRTANDIMRAFESFRDPNAATEIRPGATQFLENSATVGGGAHVKFNGVSGLWTFEGNARRNPGSSYFCFPPNSQSLLYYNATIGLAEAACQEPPP